jgi:hypothetical protein
MLQAAVVVLQELAQTQQHLLAAQVELVHQLIHLGV